MWQDLTRFWYAKIFNDGRLTNIAKWEYGITISRLYKIQNIYLEFPYPIQTDNVKFLPLWKSYTFSTSSLKCPQPNSIVIYIAPLIFFAPTKFSLCSLWIPYPYSTGFWEWQRSFSRTSDKKKDKVCPFQGKNTWNYTFLGNDKSWQKNLVNRYLSFRLGVSDEILLTSWVMWNLKQKNFKKEKKFLLLTYVLDTI